MNIADHQTSDLYVNKYGVKHCKSGSSHTRTCHHEYVLLFITEGTGHALLPSQTCSLYRGQTLLLYPDQGNYKICPDTDSNLAYMWIAFYGDQVHSLLEHTSFSSADPACSLHVSLDRVEHIFLNLLEIDGSSLPEEIRKTGYLYRLLSLLTASHRVVQQKGNGHAYPSKTYAIYAKEYIKNNYSHTSIIDIANYIGIDRSYLHHVFKKNFEVSPQEYLIQCRLSEAESLLKETSLSIQKIAHEIGYEDSLQFSRIFKKHYGCSPKCYRNSISKERGDF